MCDSGGLPPRTRAGRAQSELVGLVLVFGLVIAGATTVVVLGASAIGDSQENLETQRAEKTLTQLDSKAALVALENTDVQTVSFAGGGGRYRVLNGSGSMNVTVQNTTSGNKDDVVNQSLGTVVYDNAQSTLAYQGGGVWKSTGNGSVMVSPPEFHFRNGTLTLPIINVTGEPAIDSGAAIEHTETFAKFPVKSPDDRLNPLDEHRIFVSVKSQYYQAWGRYFEQRTDGVVKYDHAENKAKLELVSPLGKQTLSAATASRAASGSFELYGSAGMKCDQKTTVYTDSYNSSESGTYCNQPQGNEGHIIYGETVDIDAGSGSSNLRGNVISGGKVVVSGSGGDGQPDVYGHINHTDGCDPSADCPDRIMSGSGGSVNEINGISTMNNINLLTETKVDDIEADPDSASDIDPSTDTIDFSGGSATLPAGQYYLEDVTIAPGDTLYLDTSAGDVTLAIEGGIDIQRSGSGFGRIEVQGDNVAKVYMQGVDSVHGNSADFMMDKETKVVTGGLSAQENATQFRLYGPDNLTVTIGEGTGTPAKYVGVIFSPPGRAGTAEVKINGGEIFGGILTGTTSIDNGGSIHYDEALRNTQVISRDEKVVKVTYLHVTVNRIHVRNG